MPDKFKFSTDEPNGKELYKGNMRINVGDITGQTHISGYYNGIDPTFMDPVHYTFYINKEKRIVESGLTLFIDPGNYSSYRNDLNIDEVWDLSGYQNDGEIKNGVIYSNNEGSFSFNGTNNYIIFDHPVVNVSNQLTIGGWFKKESGGSNYETVLHQGESTSIGGSSYWFGIDISDNITATIGARTGVGWAAGQTSTTVTYGNWYYVCASWDGNDVSVYINGNFIKSYGLTTYSDPGTQTRIGSSGNAAGYFFSGNISIVHIYDRYLSGSEIQQNYDATKSRFGL